MFMRHTLRSRALRPLFFLTLFLTSLAARAQYNVDRLITSGEVALHYEDYVLSIQYFSKALALKPYLWQPWFDRAVAKFYLEDYVGAEEDASEAINLNPYIEDIFDLRAISRIRQQKYQEAISDYDRAIHLKPTVMNYWLNRTVCRMNLQDYDQALADADTLIQRWSKQPAAYSIKAEIYLQKADTTQADRYLAKTLALDPYNVDAWTARSYIALNRKQWRTADSCLTKVIHLRPKVANNYINRALARLNINNLSGAMDDYDRAIGFDPENFLAHYNRGLLRVQLGDDNRAIEDFDFIVKKEPQNFTAIFNRGLLNDKVGNLRAAIRDYTLVINEFPNFWTGLQYRAAAYRKLGMTAKAEMDEFRIFKAQMNKHIGIQQRWSKAKLKAVRKRSEIDPNKYNNIVVEDKPEQIQHEYKSEYRGTVQNRNVEIVILPMFQLSYYVYDNGVTSTEAYDTQVDQFNRTQQPLRKVYLTCNRKKEKLSDTQSKQIFQLIDALSSGLGEEKDPKVRAALQLQRAVAYAEAQNYDDAIADLNDYIMQASHAGTPSDYALSLAYWQRAVFQTLLNSYEASRGQNIHLGAAQAEGDFAEALKLLPKNAYLYYDRANLFAQEKNYDRAIEDYTRALQLDNSLAEAYYNRGLVRIFAGKRDAGLQDLSKAGELGLFDAYSIIKQENLQEQKTEKASKKK